MQSIHTVVLMSTRGDVMLRGRRPVCPATGESGRFPPERRRRGAEVARLAFRHPQASVVFAVVLGCLLFGSGAFRPKAGAFPLWSTDQGISSTVSVRPHPAIVRIIAAEGNVYSMGSGTLIAAAESYGLVLTNWHVIRDSRGQVAVAFPNGTRLPAVVVAVDPLWDLALLMIPPVAVPPIPIADSVAGIGERLIVAGYGKGNYRAAHGRCVQYVSPGVGQPAEMLEVSVGARQGDSGGPILNSRGELAGVLFGTTGGRTIGSHAGRVRQFLSAAQGRLPAAYLQLAALTRQSGGDLLAHPAANGQLLAGLPGQTVSPAAFLQPVASFGTGYPPSSEGNNSTVSGSSKAYDPLAANPFASSASGRPTGAAPDRGPGNHPLWRGSSAEDLPAAQVASHPRHTSGLPSAGSHYESRSGTAAGESPYLPPYGGLQSYSSGGDSSGAGSSSPYAPSQYGSGSGFTGSPRSDSFGTGFGAGAGSGGRYSDSSRFGVSPSSGGPYSGGSESPGPGASASGERSERFSSAERGEDSSSFGRSGPTGSHSSGKDYTVGYDSYQSGGSARSFGEGVRSEPYSSGGTSSTTPRSYSGSGTYGPREEGSAGSSEPWGPTYGRGASLSENPGAGGVRSQEVGGYRTGSTFGMQYPARGGGYSTSSEAESKWGQSSPPTGYTLGGRSDRAGFDSSSYSTGVDSNSDSYRTQGSGYGASAGPRSSYGENFSRSSYPSDHGLSPGSSASTSWESERYSSGKPVSSGFTWGGSSGGGVSTDRLFYGGADSDRTAERLESLASDKPEAEGANPGLAAGMGPNQSDAESAPGSSGGAGNSPASTGAMAAGQPAGIGPAEVPEPFTLVGDLMYEVVAILSVSGLTLLLLRALVPRSRRRLYYYRRRRYAGYAAPYWEP